MLSGDRQPEPLPTTRFLLLEAPLYVLYSLTHVGPEVAEAERRSSYAAQLAEAAEAAARALPYPLDSAPPAPTSGWGEPPGSRERAREKRILECLDTLDSYCVECKKPTTFKVALQNKQPYATDPIWRTNETAGTVYKYFDCTREEGSPWHRLFFAFWLDRGAFTITKIAQYPSVADLAHGGLSDYRRVLSSDDYTEFSRAIGLYSHGVGVGAFVYLRRIFERLLEEAHAQASKSWRDDTESAYRAADVRDRISMLGGFLPETLVENRGLYSILSKGLHELSEQECLAHFMVARNGIETILEDKITARRLEAKRLQAKRAVEDLHRRMKG